MPSSAGQISSTSRVKGRAATSLGFGGEEEGKPSDIRMAQISSFLAQDSPIRIVPKFNLFEPLQLVTRQSPVGPFRAGLDCEVPLWLGVMLRKRNLARIVPPRWLTVDFLRGVLAHERDASKASFCPDLPFRHAEIARAILMAASAGNGASSVSASSFEGGGEIPRAYEMSLLLEDIAVVRLDKIRKNIHSLSANHLSRPGASVPTVDVTGIGSMEIRAVGPFVCRAFRDRAILSGQSSKNKEHQNNQTRGGGGGGGNSGTAALGNVDNNAGQPTSTAPQRRSIRRFR